MLTEYNRMQRIRPGPFLEKCTSPIYWRLGSEQTLERLSVGKAGVKFEWELEWKLLEWEYGW